MVAFSWCLWDSTPFCLAWWIEKLAFPLVVGAVVALLAIWQLKKKRASDYAAEQLAKFYAPMLGMSSELGAHRQADEWVKSVNEEAHSNGLKKGSKARAERGFLDGVHP